MINKVRFLNETNEEFFVCTPAEARIAINTINNKRLKIDPIELENKEINDDIQRLIESAKKIKSDEIDYDHDAGNFLTASTLAIMFAEIQKENFFVTHIIVCPEIYRDLVKWERDILCPSGKSNSKTGIMASIFGANICVRDIEKDVIIICSSKINNGHDKDLIKVFHMNEVEKLKSKDEQTEERLLRIEEILKNISNKLT